MAEALSAFVLECLPGAVVTVDLEDRVIAWNDAAEAMFGWSAAEVMGRRPANVPDDGWELRKRWMEDADAGRQVEVTTKRVHRDGHLIDVTLQMGSVRDAESTVVGHVILCRDATLRLQLQSREVELELVRRLSSLVQRLLQDLDLSRVLQAIVEVAVDLLRVDSGVISLEREPGVFSRMANVNIPPDLADYEVVPGRGLHGLVLVSGETVVVEDYDEWAPGVDAFRGRGYRASIAVPIRREGRVIGVLSVHASEAGRLFGSEEADVLALLSEYAAVAIANATAYRRVSSQRERFLALVEAMPDGLVVVEDGAVTAWNAAAARLTGCPADDVIGRAPPLDLEAAAGGVEVTLPDGRRVWMQTVRSDLRQPRGHVYLLRDMTEQHDLDRAKDLFFATTSHELKTPLTVVKGLASTLHRHWERMAEDQRMEALATIERRAESLDRLIERILVGSRVQAGAFHPSPTPVDIRPVILDIVGGFASAAEGTHVVRAELPPELPLVAGDRQALDTILGHLIENAVKYSPGGGEVVVVVRPPSPGPDDPHLVVDVLDDGVGIDGDIEPLLAAFVQGDGRTTRRFGGVGLGLYIVDELVRAQGGAITAERRNEGGSRFSFTVPLWRDQTRSAANLRS